MDPVQQDLQLAQVAKHFGGILSRLEDGNHRIVFLKVGNDLFLFLGSHGDRDAVSMMLMQAFFRAFEIVTDMGLFKSQHFPVPHLIKGAQYLFTV